MKNDISRRGHFWTVKEDEIIKKFYKAGGPDLCKDNGLDRTLESIIVRASKLKIKHSVTMDDWTEKEIQLLIEHYPTGGSDAVIKSGVDRTSYAIITKARKLKIHRTLNKKVSISTKDNRWIQEEDAILKKYYPIGGYRLCIEKGLSRSQSSIYCRASILNISFNDPYYHKENNKLKITLSEILDLKPMDKFVINKKDNTKITLTKIDNNSYLCDNDNCTFYIFEIIKLYENPDCEFEKYVAIDYGWGIGDSKDNNFNYIITYEGKVVPISYNSIEHLLVVNGVYSTKEKAEEVANKQLLFRKLQKYADEHNKKDFDENKDRKYAICFIPENNKYIVNYPAEHFVPVGQVLFSNRKDAEMAISLFEDYLDKVYKIGGNKSEK